MKGLLRLACAVFPHAVGDPMKNAELMEKKIQDAKKKKADIVLFSQLSLSGYTCDDLFLQESLHSAVKNGILSLCSVSGETQMTIVFGTPLLLKGRLFDCGVIASCGKIIGIVPKSCETHRKNIFSSADALTFSAVSSSELGLKGNYEIPVGKNLIFNMNNKTKIGIEIGDDLMLPIPQSTFLALGGAELILCPFANSITVSSAQSLKNTVLEHSKRIVSAYAAVGAGAFESTANSVFSGQIFAAERGKTIAENTDLPSEDCLSVFDIDIDKIRADRLRNSQFKNFDFPDCGQTQSIFFDTLPGKNNGELLRISKTPFIPNNTKELEKRCLEIFNIQTMGLKKRLSITGGKAVIGISGGLDSTLALLVCVNAVKELHLPAENVFAVTMPCFGTSDRTYRNAVELIKTLGVTFKEVNIKNACLGHFRDIGQDENKFDATYENSQARERTQVLMDFSGIVGGIVVGTGDLSELALGWCTYNGDHMSMYGVNAGVPKTLIPHIIRSLSKTDMFSDSLKILKDIIDTPISPELLPPDKSGNISQETESIIGPYVLHDFFIYYVLRFGFSPKKIYSLAKLAFKDDFSDETILKNLKLFYKRFFTQQFKRDCMPGGMKIGSIGLSPRGELQMPSDASFSVWIKECDDLF